MEYWDLLDDDRRLTGETLLRGEAMPEGRFHTIIGVWTIHTKLHRILLTKRHPDKLICPNQWENTGGSLVSGEESRSGAAREVFCGQPDIAVYSWRNSSISSSNNLVGPTLVS